MRESEWLRVFETGDNRLVYESKFLSDKLQVSLQSIRSVWARLSCEQQIEFSLAFAAKPSLDPSDQEVLLFLAENGSQEVTSNIALRLCEHADRDGALRLLTQRLETPGTHLANYYVALERLQDKRAVPYLLSNYKRYRESLATNRVTSEQVYDYLYCCRALLSLDGSEEFESAIRDLLEHSDEVVRRTAARLLNKQA